MAEHSVDIADASAGARPRASVCPGLFRIVPARDGGICRIKLPLGQLSAAQARAVGQAAARFGSGIIEATNRANLQIRGIRKNAEAAVTHSLIAAGLGPTRLDADDIGNVMVSPAAGIDPRQEIDVLPIARRLLTLLESVDAHRTLSPKFCVLIDGGESLAAVDHPHDIWLASLDGGARMALGLAGAPPAEPADATPFVTIPARRAVDAVAAALALFVEEAAVGDPEPSRLRHLLVRMSRAELFGRLAERLPGVVERNDADRPWRRPKPARLSHVGVSEQRQRGLVFVGAVPPLGRLSPELLARLAEIAEAVGDGGIRLTPWQSVILPSIRGERAKRAVEALEAAGLVCDPAHPLASIVACAGAAGCGRARSDTKADALALAKVLDPAAARPLIHLSGCIRSCACPGVADVTLLATAPGRYQLFVRAKNGDSKFGRRAADDLRVAQAAHSLNEKTFTQSADDGRGGDGA